MANCPSCSEPLTGFVTRETLKTQLEAKDAAAALLSTEVTKLRGELESVADIRSAHEEATAKIAKMERAQLLSSKGITDPAIIETMEILHAAKNAGADEPVSFEDFEAWGATSNPLLASLFATEEAPETASPAAFAPPVLPTNSTTAEAPPKKQGKPTPRQVAAYLNSKQFDALPREQQDSEIARLRAEVS